MFDHDEGLAIVGGHVYRGTAMPNLYGKYLFADIPSGRVFYIDADTAEIGKISEIKELRTFRFGKEARKLDETLERVDLRFGNDVDGNIYVFQKHVGDVYRLEDLSELLALDHHWYLFKDSLDTGTNIQFVFDDDNQNNSISITMTKGNDVNDTENTSYAYVGASVIPDQMPDSVCDDCVLGVEIEYCLDGELSLLLEQDGMIPGQEYRVKLEATKKINKRFFPLSLFVQPSWVEQKYQLSSKYITGMKLLMDSEIPTTSNIDIHSIRLVLNQK
jgi:hypothetical protein